MFPHKTFENDCYLSAIFFALPAPSKGLTSSSIPPTWAGVEEFTSNADILSMPLSNLEVPAFSFFPDLTTAAAILVTACFDMEPELMLPLVFCFLLG